MLTTRDNRAHPLNTMAQMDFQSPMPTVLLKSEPQSLSSKAKNRQIQKWVLTCLISLWNSLLCYSSQENWRFTQPLFFSVLIFQICISFFSYFLVPIPNHISMTVSSLLIPLLILNILSFYLASPAPLPTQWLFRHPLLWKRLFGHFTLKVTLFLF